MAKIKELSIARGRKFAWDYGNDVGYHIGVVIEGDEADIIQMKEMAYKELTILERKEQDRCRDVAGASQALKEIKEIEKEPEIEKQPKNTKKVPANGKYPVAKKPCRSCGGFISWKGWVTGKLPIHVDQEGLIKGNGLCPEAD